MIVPPLSYSSSEDEFFDAETPSDEKVMPGKDPDDAEYPGHSNNSGKENSYRTRNKSTEEPNYGDENENFDAVYEDTEELDIGNVQQQHGSVLMHLLSQVRIVYIKIR